jgi:hypothetical protein
MVEALLFRVGADIIPRQRPQRGTPRTRFFRQLLSRATTAQQIDSQNKRRMVRVAGVEPAWTCAQDMWVAATLHPDLKRGPCSPLRF